MQQVLEIYQKQLEKRKKIVLEQYDQFENDIHTSLTQEELETVKKELQEMAKEFEDLEIPLKNFTKALAENQSDVTTWFYQLQKPLTAINDKQEILDAIMNLKEEDIQEANDQKENTKKQTAQIEKDLTNIIQDQQQIQSLTIATKQDIIANTTSDLASLKQYQTMKALLMAMLIYTLLKPKNNAFKLSPQNILMGIIFVNMINGLLNPALEYHEKYEEYSTKIIKLMDNTTAIETKITENIDKLDELEEQLEKEYAPYLELEDFAQTLQMIKDVKKELQTSNKEIENTKQELQSTYSQNKIMLKTLEQV